MNDWTMPLSEGNQQALQALDGDQVHRRYRAQNECVFLEHVLPSAMPARYLLPEAEWLRAEIHRNYIPWHKQGGSVSYYTIAEKAPAVLMLYRHPTPAVAPRGVRGGGRAMALQPYSPKKMAIGARPSR